MKSVLKAFVVSNTKITLLTNFWLNRWYTGNSILNTLMTKMGRKSNKRGDICTCIADSFCCTVETNNIVKQLYSKKNFFKIMYVYMKKIYITSKRRDTETVAYKLVEGQKWRGKNKQYHMWWYRFKIH